jgi:hypothetical protein
MRTYLKFGVVFFLASCVGTPDLEREPNAFQSKTCDQYMGKDWVRRPTPSRPSLFIEELKFEVIPQGFIWYESEAGEIGVCAYTGNSDGCGYSGYEFKLESGRWYHARMWSQDRICVVG